METQCPSANCFTINYQAPAGAGLMNGDNPDTFGGTFNVGGTSYTYNIQSGGVSPIDISSYLVASDQPQQLKIDLADQGGYVASSSLYLVTSCTSGGVNGPAMISGNTIPPTNPSNDQLDQDFTFNPVTGQSNRVRVRPDRGISSRDPIHQFERSEPAGGRFATRCLS